jgi:hypothetical protein
MAKELTLSSKIFNLITEFDSICKTRKMNFSGFSRIKNSFFKIQKEYSNEKELYDLIMTENFNKNGVGCEYYKISFDTTANPIWGEDSSRSYERKFDFMGVFPNDLPLRSRNWSMYGIEITDIYTIQISKKHFLKASTMDPSVNNKCSTNFSSFGDDNNTYSAMTPLIGDIIRNKYDGMYYEIIQVEDNQDEFLQISHEWDLTVRVFRDNHISKTNISARNGQDLSEVMDKSNDLFDLSDSVNTKKLDDIFVNPTNTSAHREPSVYVNNAESSNSKKSSLMGNW